MKKLSKKQRAKAVDKAIRLTWESLESHLHWTRHKDKQTGSGFHKNCVKDYAKTIKLISKLY